MKELIFRSITSVFLLFILYLSYFNNQFFYLLLTIIALFSLIEFYQLILKIKKKKFRKNFYFIIGILYIIFACSFLFLNLNNYKLIIFYLIIICIATDVGGFVFGKFFKGKKLTKISPNKTYAGFFGSFIISFIIMYISVNYLNLNFLIILVLTFSTSLLCQLGDLFFSYLKRLAKIKDTGNLLPGHGGILDRIDGIILSVPINLLVYILST